MNDEEKMRRIESDFKDIMLTLGLDLKDAELKETPRRVAKMYVKEIFSGLSKDNEPICTTFPNKVGYNQIIALTNIKTSSMCAHHFLPYLINVNIGYIASERYVGISKLSRVAEYMASTPSTQEVLVHKIADYLEEKLKPLGVIVYITGQHLCAGIRGIKKPDAIMITSEVRGLFRENLELETKFINMINKG